MKSTVITLLFIIFVFVISVATEAKDIVWETLYH